MSNFKLLIVEDDRGEIETYQENLEIYTKENGIVFETEIALSIDEALTLIDKPFDGAIIDIRLADGGDEGNQVIENINRLSRFPVFVVTGTPDNVDENLKIACVYRRTDDFKLVIDDLVATYNTGITNILGGKGLIEEAINHIFWEAFLPNRASWIEHASTKADTKVALLRYTINHLTEYIHDGIGMCFPEEMYISPPMTSGLKTGSIVTHIENGCDFIVICPACDLVIKGDGKMRSGQIQVCQIENLDNETINQAKKDLKIVIDEKNDNRKIKNSKKFKLQSAGQTISNIILNRNNYYHYLPPSGVYAGGLVNFRKVEYCDEGDFNGRFQLPSLNVSSSFVKDIVARFSSYYARQGQPDFSFEDLQSKLLSE